MPAGRRTTLSSSLFYAVEHGVDHQAQGGVGYTGKDFVGPTPGHLKANEYACDEEIDDLVDDIEKNGEQEASAGIFYVEFDAER